MSDTSMTRNVIHTDVDTGLSVVNDSGDEQDDEVCVPFVFGIQLFILEMTILL